MDDPAPSDVRSACLNAPSSRPDFHMPQNYSGPTIGRSLQGSRYPPGSHSRHKYPARGLAADPQFRDRFDREARTISQLDHPHICALYNVGEQDGISFLVMQYLEGETLEARLKKGRAAARSGAPVRDPDCGCTRHGAQGRHRPPRSEARQRHAHQERPSCSTSGWQRRARRSWVEWGCRCCRPRRRTSPPKAPFSAHPVHGARAARRPGG